LCVGETLRRAARAIRVLNLSRCVIPFGGLKHLLDALNDLENVSKVTLRDKKMENRAAIPRAFASLEYNTSITEYELCGSHSIRILRTDSV